MGVKGSRLASIVKIVNIKCSSEHSKINSTLLGMQACILEMLRTTFIILVFPLEEPHTKLICIIK